MKGWILPAVIGGGVLLAAQAVRVNPFAEAEVLPAFAAPCVPVRWQVGAVETADGPRLWAVFECPGGQMVPMRFGVELQAELPSAAACPGGAPGPGWVCQRGGWLPPGHPERRR